MAIIAILRWLWGLLNQNASAIQATCAFLGVVGLFLYVLDTRRIRSEQEKTNRAAVTPFVCLSGETLGGNFDGQKVASLYSRIAIRNVGEGAALKLRAWVRVVPKDFSLDGSQWFEDEEQNAFSTVIEKSNLMNGEEATVATGGFQFEDRFLTVISAEDQRGAKHQLQLLISRHDEPTVWRWCSRE
jgi:hypothetical protein